MAKQGAVKVSITGDSSGLRRELGQADRAVSSFARKGTSHFSRFGKGATGASSGLSKLAKAATAVGAGYLAIAEAKDAINVTVDLGKATIGLNKNLGIGIERASEWAAVAKVRGIEQKALAQSFGTLARQEKAAKDGTETSIDAFKRLGVTQEELKRQSFNETLGEVADGLGNLKGGADKTAISMKLFGRGWQTVVPVLREGSKAMQEQLNLARKYGATFSGGTIKSVKDLIAAQREAKFATLGLQIAFGTQLAPALSKVIPSVAKFVNQIRTGKGAGGDFADAIKDIVKVTVDVVKWFKNAVHNLDRFNQGLLHFGDGIRRVFGNVFATLLRGFGKVFDFAARLPIIGRQFRGLGDDARKWADQIDKLGEKSKSTKSALEQLTAHKWPVNIDLKMGAKWGVPGFKPLQPLNSLSGPQGGPDPFHVKRNVLGGARQLAENNRSRLEGVFAPGLGSMPLGGGGVDQFNRVASGFGLSITSGFRPGDPGFHGQNRARDYADGSASMLAFAKRMAGTFGNKLTELIHTPLGFGIKNRQVVPLSFWGARTNAGHYNHVHVALQRGGVLPGTGSGDKVPVLGEPGEGFINKRAVKAIGGSRVIDRINRMVPRFQNGGMIKALHALHRVGASGEEEATLGAIAGAESGWRFVRGDGGRSWTPWQIYQPAWGETIKRLGINIGTWGGAAKMALYIARNSGYDAWTMYNNGGYRQYLDDVESYISGGKDTTPKGKAKGKKPKLTPRQKRIAQKRKDNISRGSFAGRLRGAGSDPWTSAFAAQTDQAIALAELTPGTADDRAAQVKALQGWLGFLDVGKRTGNQSLTTTAAQNVKSAIDAIKTLDETVGGDKANDLADALGELVEQQKQNTAALKERNAYMGSIANTSKEVAIQALADVISGQIGGITSQRRRSAGDGVTVARY